MSALRLCRGLLVGALLLVAPAVGSAQIEPTGPLAPSTPDVRLQRLLAVGNIAFPAVLRPSLTGGVLWQLSLSPIRTIEEAGGMQVRRPPWWYLHLMGTGGIGFDADPDRAGDPVVGFGAFGQVGVVRRIDPSPVSAAGVVLQGMLGPPGIGPVVRVELLDNIGLGLGWMTFPGGGRRDGIFVSIDAMRCILRDLELGPCLTGR